MAGIAHRNRTNANGDATDWYVRGFMAKCAEAGVDPRWLLDKVAQTVEDAALPADRRRALQKQWMLENEIDTNEWRDAGSDVRKEMLDRIGGVEAFKKWLNRPRQPAPAAVNPPAGPNAAGRAAPAPAPAPQPASTATMPDAVKNRPYPPQTNESWFEQKFPNTSPDWGRRTDPATGEITTQEPFAPGRPGAPAATATTPATPASNPAVPTTQPTATDPVSKRFDQLSTQAQSSALLNSGWSAGQPIDAAAKQRAMEAYDAKVRQNAEERARYNKQHTGIYQTRTRFNPATGTMDTESYEVKRAPSGAGVRSSLGNAGPRSQYRAQSEENIRAGKSMTEANYRRQQNARYGARPKMVTRGDVEKERARRDWINDGGATPEGSKSPKAQEAAWRYHQVPVYRPYSW